MDSAKLSDPPIITVEGEQLKPLPGPNGWRLRRKEAALYLGVKPNTMAAWAMRNTGPAVTKAGRLAFYYLHDLEAFAGGKQ